MAAERTRSSGRPGEEASPSPANIPVCLLCRKWGEEMMPVMPAMVPQGSRVLTGVIHFGCLIDTIAGRTAEVVLDAIRSGNVSSGIELERGFDLNQTIARIVERILYHEDED
jgi:hypothetical protein